MRRNKLALAIAGAGGGEEKPRTPIEAPDSLRSIAYARILDMVGEGEIYGLANRDNPMSCVFFNETPVANSDGTYNFKNFTVETRTGTQDQDFIRGFEGVESELSINTQLKYAAPWTRSISNLNVTSARVRISTPQMSRVNASNNDLNGSLVSYLIEVSTDGGSFVPVLYGGLHGKSMTKYERSHRIDLKPAFISGWAIRVTRNTPDASSSAVQNDTYIESFAEIIDAKLRMPMTALVACVVDAEQFSNIPARAYLMRGRIIRVPSNYNAETRTYTGVWDGTFSPQYSNNPAWCFYDMATNARYGLGHLVPENLVDKWALYKIGRYCDGLVADGKGGFEPRFTSNYFLQSRAEALRVMQDMASMFRGIMYASGGSIVSVGDMPDEPAYIYNPTNVVDGKFTYEGSARKVRFTVAHVSWNDPQDFSRAKVEYVEDAAGIARYGYQPTDIIATGCTSQSQARRYGRYVLATSLYETDGVSWSIGLDGTAVAPGRIALVADPLRAGRRTGGRVISATATAVTVDILPVVSINDTLSCVLPTGESQTRTVTAITGREITVTPAFDAVPVAQSVWAVESTELSLQRVRVLAVKERTDGQGFDMVGLQQVAAKFAYADEGQAIDVPPIGAGMKPMVPSPTGITATPRDVVDQYTANVIVDVTWLAVDTATNYRFQWRQNDGEWSASTSTGATTAELTAARAGSIEVQVTARDGAGRESLPAFAGPFAIAAVSTPPGIIVDILTDQEVLEGIGLDNQQDIAQEIIDRAAADAQVQIDAAQDATAKVALEASARAAALLNEANDRTAAIATEATLRQTADESLAISVSLVSAGSGEQFDSKKIWYYDTALESWTGNGTPTIVDGWLRPANHASDPYITSPTGLAVVGQSYRFVKLRIKKVGSPVWDGAVRWRKTGDGAGVWSGPSTIVEPTFDAAGVTTISWQDIAWWPATIDQIRIDLSTAQTATDYYLVDWIAVGRPTPGAGVALVQEETSARVAGDSAEATQRNTLAVQMRGAYTGTDITAVSTGLVYSERQARAAADGVIVTDVTALQARMPVAAGVLATEASVTTEATARATADGALAGRATTIEARMPVGSGTLATVANVTDEATARATADGSLATRTGVIEARMPTGVDKLANEARVVTAETAAATATGAVSTRLGVVEARMPAGAGGLATSASVSSVDQARIDGDAAIATSITQVKAALGGGGNLLPNSDYSTNNAGLGDWEYSQSGGTGAEYPRTTSPGPTYIPAATGGMFLRSSGGAALANGAYIQVLSSASVDIDTTKDYILSVYLSAHRAWGLAHIRWLDSTGAFLAYSASTTIATSAAGGTLTSLTRVFIKATPPAGAVTAKVLIRCLGTGAAGSDSFLFIAAPMLEEAAGVAQTTPSPYSAGVAGLGAITQIAQVTADAATGKINAAFSLVLDVNNYVTGFKSENTGTYSTFSIVADKFQLIAPGGGARIEWTSGNQRVYDAAGVLRVRIGVW